MLLPQAHLPSLAPKWQAHFENSRQAKGTTALPGLSTQDPFRPPSLDFLRLLVSLASGRPLVAGHRASSSVSHQVSARALECLADMQGRADAHKGLRQAFAKSAIFGSGCSYLSHMVALLAGSE